jgi:opacity protein-like surface antigen
MNKLVLLAAAGAAVLLASACAADGAYVGGDIGIARFAPGHVRCECRFFGASSGEAQQP